MVLYRPSYHKLANSIVSVRNERSTKLAGDNHFCAGVIISPHIVLTAAQCLTKSNGIKRFRKLYVVTGSPFLFKMTEKTRVYKAASFAVHPKFDYHSQFYDIGIIRLERKVEEKSTFFIPLRWRLPHHDDICTILGWGPLYSNGPRPHELVYIDLTILNRSLCRTERPVLSAIFCVNGVDTHGEAVWRGDSGSPLICNGELTGIIGTGTYQEKAPILFSSIYESQWWLNTILDKKEISSRNTGSRAFHNFLFIIKFLIFWLII